MSRLDNTIILQQGAVKMTVAGVGTGESVLPLGADGSLQMDKSAGARIQVEGFMAGERVGVWMFSQPSQLGSALTDADGKVSGTFPLPPGIKAGRHRLVLTGLDDAGKKVTFAVAATITDPDARSSSGFNPVVLMLPLLLAAFGALFLPAVLRRRRSN